MDTHPNPSAATPEDFMHRISLELMGETTLQAVLEKTAAAARQLTDASFAMVALPKEKGEPERIASSGEDPDSGERISFSVPWLEMLAVLYREGGTLASADLSADPRCAGLSAGWNRLHSFMGALMIFQGQILGEICLAGKADAPGFETAEQNGIQLLAAWAAAAIENSRRYAKLLEGENDLTRKNQELAIFNDVSLAASTTLELEGILATTLDRMMLHFHALNGQIFLLEEDAGDVRMAMQRGEFSAFYWEKDVFSLGEGLVGRAAESKEFHIVSDPPQEPGFDDEAFRANGLRMLLGIPLLSKGRVMGVMMLASTELVEFTARQKALFEAVGLSVGTAVENGLLHRKAQRLAVFEERERIGMDLHDGIIQSIYAVGLMLEEGLLEMGEVDPNTRSKLQRAIDGLNAVIRDIREYIADLRPKRFIFDNLAVGLQMLVREFLMTKPIDAEIDLSEEAGRWLAPVAANDLFLIAQEALSNVARHANATRLKVTLAQVGDRVVLEVADNGRGFDPAQRRSDGSHGLANMEERAHAIRGELTVTSEPGKGARVRVSIPRLRPQTGNLAGREYRGAIKRP
jgi:two-component system, NarL family, sensor histidine kinase DevS